MKSATKAALLIDTQIFFTFTENIDRFSDLWELVLSLISAVALNMKALDIGLNKEVLGIITAVSGVANTLDLYWNAKSAIYIVSDIIKIGDVAFFE